ncbi:hypothetical protein CHS0354_021443 [Potamilus streckersoni]|uniref:Uncharacterized protein n=1 Tax=Potamilus streckersoni TaxID=2493646 RepID=A0AAE0VMH4_9BIVA|nr:hypothetical protein CHS0354_021443 [Potamilus streckersoni]
MSMKMQNKMMTMGDLPRIVKTEKNESENLNTALRTLRYNGLWDPSCDEAIKALKYAFKKSKIQMCDLLVHEGVKLKMKDVLDFIGTGVSLATVKNVIDHLKATGKWDPSSKDAQKAIEYAKIEQETQTVSLLRAAGVSERQTRWIYVVATLFIIVMICLHIIYTRIFYGYNETRLI